MRTYLLRLSALALIFTLGYCTKGGQQQTEEPVQDEQQEGEEGDVGEGEEGEPQQQQDGEQAQAQEAAADQQAAAPTEPAPAAAAETPAPAAKAETAAAAATIPDVGFTEPAKAAPAAPSASTNNENRVVRFIKFANTPIYNQPSAQSQVVAKYRKGDPIVVNIRGDWAEITPDRFVQVGSLSEELIPRDKEANSWR